MRQAVEPSWRESMDAIEEMAALLLDNSGDEQAILSRAAETLAEALDYAAALIVTGEEEQESWVLRAYALRVSDGVAAEMAPRLQEALDGERRLSPKQNAEDVFELLYPLLEEQEAAQWQEMAQIRGVRVQPLSLPGEPASRLLILSARPRFAEMERRALQAAAQQLALGVRNAHLYQRLAEQEHAAQTFAHMAFSGSAYVHTLRNQIGGLRTYLGLVKVLPHLEPAQQDSVVATSHMALKRLDQATEILDHLHEPWRRQPEAETDANDCLTAALVKVFGGITMEEAQQAYVTSGGLRIEWQLAPEAPGLRASREMLTEAFRVVIRNAAEALQEKYGAENMEDGLLQIGSAVDDKHVVVTMRDNGPGIAPGDLGRIFDMGWSTKKGMGMGFGLFWARSVVEGLGGHIEVESAPDDGAAFHFYLPAPHTHPQ